MAGSSFPEEHIINIDVLVHSRTTVSTCPLSDEIHISKNRLPVIHEIKNRVLDREKEVFRPKYVSIGPYHYGNPDLADMQKVKYFYLDYILKLNPEKKLGDYLAAVRRIEEDVKCAYANEIKIDGHTFLKTLLLDGCFILLTLCGIEGIIPGPDNSMLDANQGEVNANSEGMEDCQWQTITQNSTEQLSEQENSNQDYLSYDTMLHDILLLENQVPFGVVRTIFEVLTAGTIGTSSLLTKNIIHSIENMVCFYPKHTPKDRHPGEFHHLLHLCHMLFKPNRPFISQIPYFLTSDSGTIRSIKEMDHYPQSEKLTRSQRVSLWRAATQYRDAKIEFKKRELVTDNPHSLLDIGFCNSTIQIPCLSIEPMTHSLLHNLVAFEQTCPQFGNHITSYVLFWSQLVSTPDDASLLIEKGIIINHLQSDKEVTDLLSALAKDVAFDSTCGHYLNPVCHMVEVCFQCQRFRWRKILGTVGSKIHCWVSQSKPKLSNMQSVGSLL